MTLRGLPLVGRARRRRAADGGRHGRALGESHLAAPLGGTAAPRLRRGARLPRAAASPAHRGERRHRAHAARRGHDDRRSDGQRLLGVACDGSTSSPDSSCSCSARSCRARSRGAGPRRRAARLAGAAGRDDRRRRRSSRAGASSRESSFASAEAPPTRRSWDAIQDLLREGELEGVGEHEEIAIISGVVEFSEKVVREVMTPRDEIFALADGVDAAHVASSIAQSGYSRVPCIDGSLDDIVGMVHAFDVLKARGERCRRFGPSRAPRSTRRATSSSSACSASGCISRSCATTTAQTVGPRDAGGSARGAGGRHPRRARRARHARADDVT